MQERDPDQTMGTHTPFVPGTMILVWLGSPRERFWGMLLDLSPAGLSIRGIDLNSFDGFVSLLRAGEPAMPGELFFPMHRIERIEVDLRSGDVPSLTERFHSGAGHSARALFGQTQKRSVPHP